MRLKLSLLGTTDEVLVAGLNAFNIVVAFAAQFIIYAFLGASEQTDAYFASIAFAQVAATVTGVTASGALVPILASRSASEQNRIAWNTLAAGCGSMLMLVVPAALTAQSWAPRVFPGFGESQRGLIAALVTIQVAALPFIVANALLTALHHSRRRFIRMESVNLLMGVAVVTAFWFALPRHGIMAAAWIMASRYALQVAILLPQAGWPTLRRFRSDVAGVWKRARALLAGNTYFKADVLVDRYLLSMAAAGSLSLVSLVQSAYGAMTSVIGQAWGNTAVPPLAVAFGAANYDEFRNIYKRNFVKIAVLSITVFVLVIGLGRVLMGFLTTEAFTADMAQQTWVFAVLLGGILLFGGLGSLLSCAFYATGDTRTPTMISAVSFTLFVVAKVIVFKLFGLFAFCALTSLYYFANATVMKLVLIRRLRG